MSLDILKMRIEYWMTEARFYANLIGNPDYCNDGYINLYNDALNRVHVLISEYEELSKCG